MGTKQPIPKIFSVLLVFVMLIGSMTFPTSVRAIGTILYVDDDANGTFTGASWVNAYKKLQNALAAAVPGDQIWVAAGIYYPDEGTTQINNSRAESFLLVNGVAVYGGFNGTETLLSQRSPATNVTILSGDIQQDDTNTDGNNIAESITHIQGSNAYGVVSSAFGVVDSTAILDGFVITAGKADGSPLQSTTVGGGVRLVSGDSPTLANLTIIGNDALANGGGMFNGANSNPALTGVTFTGNHANNGGGVYTEDSSPTLTAVTFNGNSANNGGGMSATISSAPTLANVVFTNNSVVTNGGGMVISSYSVPLLTDVSFTANNAAVGGGLYIGVASNPALSRVTINQNTADYGAGIYLSGNMGTDFAYYTAENMTVSDNNAVFDGGGMYAYYGNASLTNVTFSNNSALRNGGGIYNDNSSASYFRNILIANNVGGDCMNTGGSGSSVDNSLFEDVANACGAVNGVNGNILGLDPNLGPLADNGGSTLTISLLPGSPAINSGMNNGCPATDQRGMIRPLGGICDIGAYETVQAYFADVPTNYWSWSYVERLRNAGITGGCSAIPLNYCPTTPVTRAQMAIFLLRGMHGSAYTPPAATGTKFTDVPLGTFGAAWIEQLATEGITSGCGGGNYCPTQTVSRAQMAIFLVRAKHGVAFVPPTATGIFPDVPVGSFGANYIEQLVADAITSGCGGGNYCPNTMVKRDSMAVFLVKTFNLP
jgi:predicted outer membrane repeat protein